MCYAELLLEIGTEEIPSGYLENGVRELRSLAETCLKENRIETEDELQTFGTPRRLIIICRAVSETQKDLVMEITGPPKSVAYNDEGIPTKAALGFARKQGIPVEELKCINTSKGEYLYVRRRFRGERTIDILARELPKLIATIPWPKSMRWGSIDIPFVRPVHWVLALLNGEVIQFEFAGVRSGKITWGHRFMSSGPLEPKNIDEYLKVMGENHVIIDQHERKQIVTRLVKKAAEGIGGRPARDSELISTVANLAEYPSAVCGSFDDDFLDIPEPVLITAMKKHQKYFAVYDDKDQLMPNFVAVNNTVTRDESIVKKGHERVLRARLSDASFFFKEDMKQPLMDRLENLKGVIYQADLGTSFKKVQRFTRLTEYVGEKVLGEKVPKEKLNNLSLAAKLSKCDLVTQMVMEFPDLQGVMGREYARLEGYPADICLSIYDHYLPVRAGDSLPESEIGAIVGLADRMDTITGCFAIGLEPTGSADPFALRRNALAIIRIMEDMKWELSLKDFILKALSILSEDLEVEIESVCLKVINFFRERYRQMMLRSGYESDLVEAVISVKFDRIDQLRNRIEQLRRFASGSEDFHALALTIKRVANILKKEKKPFVINTGLFKEESESRLWETYCALKDDVYSCIEKADYYQALNLMTGLRKPVDDFFDGVEVMIKDDIALRSNRIGLLQHLRSLFESIADFSRFSI